MCRDNGLLIGIALTLMMPAVSVAAPPLPAAPDVLPPAAEVAAARKVVREVYRDALAQSTPKGRQETLAKLMRQAADPAEDPASRYALILEAATIPLATPVPADGGAVLWIDDELDRRFPTAALDVRLALLDSAARALEGPGGARVLVDGYLSVTDAAWWAGNVRTAHRAADRAAAVASRAESPALLALAKAKSAFLKDLSAEATAARPPAEAAQVRALVDVITQGNWSAALPAIATGTDKALAELAARDLAGPSTATAMAELGDAYYQYATGKQKPLINPAAARAAAALRATFWYQSAIGELQGLSKVLAEKRLSALQPLCPFASRETITARAADALLACKWSWPGAQMTFTRDGHVSHRGMRATYTVSAPRASCSRSPTVTT